MLTAADHASGKYLFSTAELYLRKDVITTSPPKELPLNFASYQPSVIKIHSGIMSHPKVDEYQRSHFIRALWMTLDAIPYEEYRFRQKYREAFDMRRFMKSVDFAVRKTLMLPIVNNADGTIAIVRPPLVNAVRGQLMSFLELAHFITSHRDPFRLLRPWRQPADAVVSWWRANLPQVPVDALWTRSDRDLIVLLVSVPGYLKAADLQKMQRIAEEKARVLTAKKARNREMRELEASWEGGGNVPNVDSEYLDW